MLFKTRMEVLWPLPKRSKARERAAEVQRVLESKCAELLLGAAAPLTLLFANWILARCSRFGLELSELMWTDAAWKWLILLTSLQQRHRSKSLQRSLPSVSFTLLSSNEERTTVGNGTNLGEKREGNHSGKDKEAFEELGWEVISEELEVFDDKWQK